MKPASATPMPKRITARPTLNNPGPGATITTMPEIKAAIPKIIATIPTHLMPVTSFFTNRNFSHRF
jgi:hypothetical protein